MASSPTELKMNFGAKTPHTMRCLECIMAQTITKTLCREKVKPNVRKAAALSPVFRLAYTTDRKNPRRMCEVHVFRDKSTAPRHQ